MPDPIRTGLFPGMSYLTYSAIPALNWSRLEPYLRSAAHGRAAELEAEDSKALDLGTAIHRAILEPQLLDEEFVAAPEDAPAKRSKEEKAWWADFNAKAAGKTVLAFDDLALVRRCAEAAYRNARFAALMAEPSTRREVVVVGMNEGTGMYEKVRLDVLGPSRGTTLIVDVKSTRDASPDAFSRDVAHFNYHGQLAYYRRVLNSVAPYPRSCAFLAIEKNPTVAVFYELDEASLEVGDRDIDVAMERFIEAERTKNWPGYPDGVTGLPAWRLKR